MADDWDDIFGRFKDDPSWADFPRWLDDYRRSPSGRDAVPPNTSREAWEAWFDRLGTVATAEVVNATANLVIAERDLAIREAEDAALERAAELADKAIGDSRREIAAAIRGLKSTT